MNRITPEMVVQAYKVSKLDAKQSWGELYAERTSDGFIGEGCAMDAVCYAAEKGLPGDQVGEPSEYAAEVLGLEPEYVDWFINGFDGCGYGGVFKSDISETAYRDGVAARKAVFGEDS